MRCDYHLLLLCALHVALLSAALGLKEHIRRQIQADPVQFGPRQYCEREHFNASCPHDSVIMMSQARYGRMGIGRCMQHNVFNGCSVDVLSYMDSVCSGKRSCLLEIPGDELLSMTNCPNDVRPYLEASYSCVKVLTGEHQECRHNQIIKTHKKKGYIASTMSEQLGLGSSQCPWILQAFPGQRINISRLNFIRHAHVSAPGSGNLPQSSSGTCYEIAIVGEDINGSQTERKVSSCRDDTRDSHVYLSSTPRVKVVILQRSTDKLIGTFLLQFTVVGCQELKAPPNGWVHRSGDNATVKCNNSGETWYLTCVNSRWTGQMGNCTTTVMKEEKWTIRTMFNSGSAFPFGILIAVSIGVALGVFFGGLLLALVVVRSKRRRRPDRGASQTKTIYDSDKATARSTCTYATSGYDTASDKYSDWCVEGRLLSERDRGDVRHDIRHHMMCPIQLAASEEDKALCPVTDVPDVTLARPRPHMYECPKFV